MRRAQWLVFVGVLAALGACQKKTANTAANGGASATVAGGTGPASASAPAMAPGAPKALTSAPVRRAGLWEQSVASDGREQTTRLCLDEALAKRFAAWGGNNPAATRCTKQSMTPRLTGGWSFSSTCDMGAGGKTSTEGVLTGDPASRYEISMQSSTTGAQAPLMNGVHKISLKAAWVGPCPSGMKPGDMSLPGGMTINIATGGAGG